MDPLEMDPLKVTTSIAGLLLAAGQVTSAIFTIKSILSEAPRMVDEILSQIAQIEACLSAIQKLLCKMNSESRQRMALIKVEHLVTSLTQAVLTFSKLEALVNKIITGPRTSLMLRVNWTLNQNKLASIMLQLESHKSSLSLMLSIAQWSVFNVCSSVPSLHLASSLISSIPNFTLDVQADMVLKCISESDLEASRSSDVLHQLTNQILASNKDVSKRLRHLEDMYESESIYTVCHRNGSSDSESGFSVQGMMETSDMFQITRRLRTVPELTAHQSFHLDLNTSRVYRRTLSYECDTSFTTSVVRTHAWSVFTGVSLSEISEISVIALPLSARDISNPQWYFKCSENPGYPPSKPDKKIPASPLRTATERRKAMQRTQSWRFSPSDPGMVG
ncbi:hypothetical protein BGZ57DRAFT_436722 [Hyaloscypha finlandica]|nr:hypothetical protein BGZ57DRAFT_436722 [Hyaloscypha finlandica]